MAVLSISEELVQRWAFFYLAAIPRESLVCACKSITGFGGIGPLLTTVPGHSGFPISLVADVCVRSKLAEVRKFFLHPFCWAAGRRAKRTATRLILRRMNELT